MNETTVIRLIKKYINLFMCCCVGSTIGEGNPNDLEIDGTPGQIYFDTVESIIYIYNGTEWIGAGGSGSDSLWIDNDGIPTSETAFIGMNPAYLDYIGSGLNQVSFVVEKDMLIAGGLQVVATSKLNELILSGVPLYNNNADALTALEDLNTVYQTPSGDLRLVRASVTEDAIGLTFPQVYSITTLGI